MKQCYGKEYAALSVTFSSYTLVRYCASWNLCDNELSSTKGNKTVHNKTYPEILAALL
jgi:hypothetical protein